MAKEIKYCNTCAYLNSRTKKCTLTDLPTNPDVDFCSRHNTNPPVCATCGRYIIVPPNILPTGQLICPKCLIALSTCAGCRNNTNPCLFETDPSPTPKVVMQNVRKDNMTLQMQIRNPVRIDEICKQKCPCFINNECNKQFNYCANHKCIIQEKENQE